MLPAAMNLGAADTAVIISLWGLKFWDDWLQALIEHTSAVIYGDFVESESFQGYSVALLFWKCAFACVVAFTVDVYNHKFSVALGGTASCFLTIILALCMCITKSVIFVRLTLAASSLLFVTAPAIFGLIFDQKETPVRRQVRRLVSVMEFVDGLQLFIVHEVIPEEAEPSERYAVIVCWVIVIPFFVFIVTILERIRRYVSPGISKERGVIAVCNGLRKDVSGKPSKTGLSKSNVVLFVLILLPAFSLTSLESIVSNLKPQSDTQFQHPSVKRIISFAQLTVIPLTEVVVSHIPIKEVLAEMVVLGLAHILNIAVLTLLVIRMSISTASGHRSVINNRDQPFPQNPTLQNLLTSSSMTASSEFNSSATLDLPITSSPKRFARQIEDKTFAAYLYNPTFVQVTVQDDPQLTLLDVANTILESQVDPYIKAKVHMTGIEMFIKITFTPDSPGPPPFTKTIQFKEKKAYFIRLVEDQNGLDILITGGDIEYPEILSKPIIFVHNTFVGGEYWGKTLGHDHEVRITTSSGSPVFVDTLPDQTEVLQVEVPEGLLKLTVVYLGTNPVIGHHLHKADGYIHEVDIKPRSVNIIPYTILRARSKPIAYYRPLDMFTYYQGKPPNVTTTTAAPPQPEQPDAVLQTTLTMFGATLGLTSVGYIHFFWMGSPVRLRATLYAWFLVSNRIIGWVSAQIVGHEIGLGEGVGMLTLAILTAIWHCVMGWYYEHKIMPDAIKRKRRLQTSTATRH